MYHIGGTDLTRLERELLRFLGGFAIEIHRFYPIWESENFQETENHAP